MSEEQNQAILIAALEGFENQLARLESQIAYVRSQIKAGYRSAGAGEIAPKAAASGSGSGKKGRAVSEDGRRRMAEAQKRRWAKVHASQG